MRDSLKAAIDHALTALVAQGDLPEGTDFSNVRVERPREKSHGDFSTNAALALSKAARCKPRDLAEKLIAALPADGDVESCEIAGPGFINFRMSPNRLRAVISDVFAAGANYGRGDWGGGEKVLLEYVSANPTGPMHVGHGRGAVTGDALSRILDAAGYDVTREYYINDAGGQIYVLGKSVLLRYAELFGDAITIPDGCYPSEYVIDIAQRIRDKDGDKWLTIARENPDAAPRELLVQAMDVVLGWIRQDLEKLEIRFDEWFSEYALHSEGAVAHAIDVLASRGCLYEGVLEPPKGKQPEDWEARPQRLFKATDFGDEVDRPIQKSDGSYTYFAADIAYHLNKLERGYGRLINVWGADHGGYVKRVEAAIEALTGRKNVLDVRLVQMVNLTRGGEPVKMSKRAGNFVTLREVTDETGADAVRFWFLTRAGTSQLDFDLDLAVSKSNENPVYYVQYAHARVCSLWRQAAEKGLGMDESRIAEADLSALGEAAELDLIRLMDLFPEVVQGAAESHEPHRIPYYLLELAAALHAFYNGHRVLGEDVALRDARMALMTAVRQVIANGLQLIGVQATEQM
ncbi:arginine--tRNA ligase [Magnetofaba australis]|uniref:Arginine--tRNA ligase n=1 Tax=Magnetofaba australis IT-1 TaxID=1434232 RepID=A0A1Y2K8Y0_9PROT|nr:arginine--tRNA ligase [Magnetofaba australis]OSM07198.1 putative arginyl-tRNA synthetase [Magnetofaba australis IT-1]